MPIRLDASRWVTRQSRRTLLVVVHTVTSAQRLLEVTQLLNADLRVQVVFTVAPDVFNHGAADLLHDAGCVVLPWQQAVEHRFDLAIAAAYGGIDEVHAPLVVLPHGAGYNKLISRRMAGGAVADREVYGLAAQELIRDGMVIPSAIVLAHEMELRLLAESCPAALPVARVIGDPCHDRLVASLPDRAAYRRAHRVDDDRELVVVTSTWGPRSLFGRHARLLRRIFAELPRERYRVAALLHPNVWYGHGVWQIRTWLADCIRDGLALVAPEADWRGALVAADHIIGDHGSVAVYGAVTGATVMLAGRADGDVDPRSAAGVLAATIPALRPGLPLVDQLRQAAVHTAQGDLGPVVERLTSQPARFNRNMRRLLYGLMGLPQPRTTLRAEPVPPPTFQT